MPTRMSSSPGRVMLTADAIGGVWNYALDLARGFAAREIETILVILGPSPSPAQRERAEGISKIEIIDTGLPLEWTTENEDDFARAALLLSELATGLHPDLVHLNTPALASVDYSFPVVVTAHSCVATWWRAMRNAPMPTDFRWRTRATREGLDKADAVIAGSHRFAESLREIYGAARPVAVVHNGRPAVRNTMEKQLRLIFTAGRLWDEGKNVALLDRVAAEIDTPIVAAGPLCAPNGAAMEFSHLRLLGSLSEADIAPWYAKASIFVSPALYEPFGLAVLEAAQAGAALVLSPLPSFRELWDGVAIFLDAADTQAWVKVLQRMVEAPDWVATLGAAARERAQRYTDAAMVGGTLDVYREVLGQKAPILLLFSPAVP